MPHTRPPRLTTPRVRRCERLSAQALRPRSRRGLSPPRRDATPRLRDRVLKGCGERRVSRAPCRRGGGVVQRRADERVPEPDRRERDADQPGVFRLDELIRREPRGVERAAMAAASSVLLAASTRSASRELAPERFSSGSEGCLETLADPGRLAAAGAARRVVAPEPSWELEQGERVPTGHSVKPCHVLVAFDAAEREELSCCFARQTGDVDLLEARGFEAPALAHPRGNDDGDALGVEPADGKAKASADSESSQWASSSTTTSGVSSAAAASRLSVAAPTVSLSGDGPTSRASAARSAAACALGELVDPCEQWPRHLEQPAERHLGLRLHALRPNDEHARARSTAYSTRAVFPMPASPRSSMPPLAPVSRFLQEPADRRALELAPQEHAANRTASAHEGTGSGVPRKRSPLVGWHDRSRRDGPAHLRTSVPRPRLSFVGPADGRGALRPEQRAGDELARRGPPRPLRARPWR